MPPKNRRICIKNGVESHSESGLGRAKLTPGDRRHVELKTLKLLTAYSNPLACDEYLQFLNFYIGFGTSEVNVGGVGRIVLRL